MNEWEFFGLLLALTFNGNTPPPVEVFVGRQSMQLEVEPAMNEDNI